MEDPKYDRRHWTINKLFESKEVQSNFYRYIVDYPLTSYKNVWQTTLVHLKSNIEEVIKTHTDDYSIKEEDFKDNDLNLSSLFEKLSKVMENKDINSRSKIGKLKFEPFSLKRPFYAKLEALKFNTCDEISDLRISSLKNKIADKLFIISPKPYSISWDDFTSDGLKFESIYNKIKQGVEDGQYGKKDTINNLFKHQSNIAKIFYTKLRALQWTYMKYVGQIATTRIQNLLIWLEKEVDVPSTKDNSITKADLIGEDWDLHSIYEKIINVTKTKNFDNRPKLGKLVFEHPILRREFYSYIKCFELTQAKDISHTTILALKRNLEKELDPYQ